MTRITKRTFLKTTAGTALALAWGQTAQATANQAVTIKGFAFVPATIDIKAGDTVTFTNLDGAPHTATADDGSFDTATLRRGKSAALTFSKAGEFSYFCKFHKNMKAVIRVS